MYIAYSALQTMQQHNNAPTTPGNELQLRYQAYQTTCSKYRRQIAEIQKYIPGWQPKFY